MWFIIFYCIFLNFTIFYIKFDDYTIFKNRVLKYIGIHSFLKILVYNLDCIVFLEILKRYKNKNVPMLFALYYYDPYQICYQHIIYKYAKTCSYINNKNFIQGKCLKHFIYY